ncbi:MAG: hypothetical protein IPH11_13545 [Ignavibacteriales bacterium]|nr:hypothetical protein [Ignavibacteriales bacterium]
MQKSTKYYLFFFLLSVISIYSPSIFFGRKFGPSSADDFGRSVIETSDNNIVLLGYTGSCCARWERYLAYKDNT